MKSGRHLPPRTHAGSAEREALIHRIEQAFAALDSVQPYIRTFQSGELILDEGIEGGRIGLILEGKAALLKRPDEDPSRNATKVRVDTIGRGEIIGLLSYLAREINFVGVYADTEVRVFLMEWEAFDTLLDQQAELSEDLSQLMRDNLMGRYRRLVKIHLDVARLNKELAAERAELKETIEELNHTRSRLVNQEKLAMLGKIVAGLAHELNNPVAAISRNTEYLAEIVQRFIGLQADDPRMRLWENSEQANFLDTRAQRERSEFLKKHYPKLSRQTIRRLSAVPPDLIDLKAPPARTDEEWDTWLSAFEAGRFLHTLRSASSRIARLVRSLKNYARPDQDRFESIDVVSGLRDTLLILAHHFKEMEVCTDFADLPQIQGNAGELNQVWTNLLVNASEAMNGKGTLCIQADRQGDKEITISITDSGPGLPADKLAVIFEPHFTTKAQGGQFGLGLGLSIAQQIVEKHSGRIQAENTPQGGARFRVILPLNAQAPQV